MTKKQDPRDCPKCGTRMEQKGVLDTEDVEFWQCPECKNIEMLY